MVCSVVTGWKKLSGEKKWEGLLQPLNPDLRPYLIHNAQSAGAAGDLFNCKTHESDATEQDFFSKACLPSWFGYVAVATDEGKHVLGRRDILIAWRGTATSWEWLNDFVFIIQRDASDLFPTAREHKATVHWGFHSLYTGTRSDSPHTKTSARQQVLDAVKELVNKYKDEETSITVTGFSLGAALATLTAMDIVANGYNKPTQGDPVMVTAFAYGGPRVGNAGLADVFHTLGDHLHLLRIKNEKDSIPTLPPWFFSYAEFGIKLIVDTNESKYLKKRIFGSYAVFLDEHELNDIGSLDEVELEYEPKRKRVRSELSSLDEDEYEPKRRRVRGILADDYSCHNMDVYAHGVAIKDVDKNIPADKLDYDIALVNKYLDRVKNEYKIPPNWWVGDNRKKMFQLQNGRWVVI
ncbi:hypothetical protein F3Y22_tig00111779pilonHSYRG00203 [Hibiscus syriacus]|uniref:Phospholipase A1 n=1 Tax=Hibiscus syriacus TaxID=106335 RepID=A0A6A2XUN0_HIBSY|nr:hypothetical protein F3Y22_tig00111779pilonHSYRG00203 [Hibiscus syriacus]